ncbi:hypothetical protein CEXT_1541 [Caerostris extrusa]|uniref:Uncharacterized protein n=1 Tax=Caerostris extrusa TaxID=172846 RepID=A0AAV4PM82_CAEEX|nr:hypothetical protein CEXT_1541 [Caerostris extrusa]
MSSAFFLSSLDSWLLCVAFFEPTDTFLLSLADRLLKKKKQIKLKEGVVGGEEVKSDEVLRDTAETTEGDEKENGESEESKEDKIIIKRGVVGGSEEKAAEVLRDIAETTGRRRKRKRKWEVGRVKETTEGGEKKKDGSRKNQSVRLFLTHQRNDAAERGSSVYASFVGNELCFLLVVSGFFAVVRRVIGRTDVGTPL